MKFKDYEEIALLNRIYGSGDNIIYPALGLGNEAGEVQGKIKKVIRDEGGVFTTENKAKIADECGDVLWYLAALSNEIGYSLSDIAQLNIKKLLSRRERGVIGGSEDNR